MDCYKCRKKLAVGQRVPQRNLKTGYSPLCEDCYGKHRDAKYCQDSSAYKLHPNLKRARLLKAITVNSLIECAECGEWKLEYKFYLKDVLSSQYTIKCRECLYHEHTAMAQSFYGPNWKNEDTPVIAREIITGRVEHSFIHKRGQKLRSILDGTAKSLMEYGHKGISGLVWEVDLLDGTVPDITKGGFFDYDPHNL